jgi:hypothetical protein
VDAHKGPNNHIDPFPNRFGNNIITISGKIDKSPFSVITMMVAMAKEGLLLLPW